MKHSSIRFNSDTKLQNRRMQYRSREKIVYQILTKISTNKNVLMTHVMYDCRLSYAQLKEYMGYLEKNKLIESAGSIITISPKGREILKAMDQVFSVKMEL
jgi:predicted transcriptional regulator